MRKILFALLLVLGACNSNYSTKEMVSFVEEWKKDRVVLLLEEGYKIVEAIPGDGLLAAVVGYNTASGGYAIWGLTLDKQEVSGFCTLKRYYPLIQVDILSSDGGFGIVPTTYIAL